MLDETDGATPVKRDAWGNDDVPRLKRKVQQLEDCMEEMEQRRVQLTDEKDNLQMILQDKEKEITRKNEELRELRNTRVLFMSFKEGECLI